MYCPVNLAAVLNDIGKTNTTLCNLELSNHKEGYAPIIHRNSWSSPSTMWNGSSYPTGGETHRTPHPEDSKKWANAPLLGARALAPSGGRSSHKDYGGKPQTSDLADERKSERNRVPYSNRKRAILQHRIELTTSKILSNRTISKNTDHDNRKYIRDQALASRVKTIEPQFYALIMC